MQEVAASERAEWLEGPAGLVDLAEFVLELSTGPAVVRLVVLGL